MPMKYIQLVSSSFDDDEAINLSDTPHRALLFGGDFSLLFKRLYRSHPHRLELMEKLFFQHFCSDKSCSFSVSVYFPLLLWAFSFLIFTTSASFRKKRELQKETAHFFPQPNPQWIDTSFRQKTAEENSSYCRLVSVDGLPGILAWD